MSLATFVPYQIALKSRDLKKINGKLVAYLFENSYKNM